jgi:hypothetical protein
MKSTLVITESMIRALGPCRDRLENYLKFYSGKPLTAAQFMGRKNLTQADKLWVAFRIMNKDHIRLAAADIAESVLHIYEAAYPGDLRPRQAIEAARSGSADAARSAESAARAAAESAWSAAESAWSAAESAARSAARSAAESAAGSAARAAVWAAAQEKAIRKILLRYLK